MKISIAGAAFRAILIFGTTCAFFLAAGCATDGDAGATFDPLTAFPARALWVWNDAANKLPDSDRIDREALDQRIRSAVAAEFAAKGYSETTAKKVHYVLSYEVGIHTWTSQTVSRAFGSLSVLMSEAASGRKVWLGFVRMQIDMSLTTAQREERLRANIARMLENFPPAQPK